MLRTHADSWSSYDVLKSHNATEKVQGRKTKDIFTTKLDS